MSKATGRKNRPEHHIHTPGGECCGHNHEDETEAMLDSMAEDPIGSERAMRDLRHMLRGKKITSEQEFAAVAAGFDEATAERARAERLSVPKERAHDLALSAYEAPDEASAQRLAREALELDPGCLDALLIGLQGVDTADDEKLQKVEDALTAAAEDIRERAQRGDDPLLDVEAQPMLRARMAVAELRRAKGEFDRAAPHFMEILRLAPDDEQAASLLLGCALAMGDLKLADMVWSEFADPELAVFAWARPLHKHLAGDARGAKTALAKARATNTHVEEFLTMRRQLDDIDIEYDEPGGEDEARAVLYALGPAWLNHGDAMQWLAGQIGESR